MFSQIRSRSGYMACAIASTVSRSPLRLLNDTCVSLSKICFLNRLFLLLGADLCISVRIDKSRRQEAGTSNSVSLVCHENKFPSTSSDFESCNPFKKLGDIDSFPLITDKHRSLACKAMKANPELYTKYANVKTPMGFTFDQAIQVTHCY